MFLWNVMYLVSFFLSQSIIIALSILTLAYKNLKLWLCNSKYTDIHVVTFTLTKVVSLCGVTTLTFCGYDWKIAFMIWFCVHSRLHGETVGFQEEGKSDFISPISL